MELKITITEQELELLPYVALAHKIQLDSSKSAEENAETVATAIKASLLEKAKQMKLEQISLQARAQEAARLEQIVPPKDPFTGNSFI